MDTGSPDPAAALRRTGLRVTARRVAVLTACTADVDCAVGDILWLLVAEDSGYEIHEAEVIFMEPIPERGAVTPVSSGELKRTRSVRYQLVDTALDPD